eukprot:9491836-Pyramimonas_sp.AAC.1
MGYRVGAAPILRSPLRRRATSSSRARAEGACCFGAAQMSFQRKAPALRRVAHFPLAMSRRAGNWRGGRL